MKKIAYILGIIIVCAWLCACAPSGVGAGIEITFLMPDSSVKLYTDENGKVSTESLPIPRADGQAFVGWYDGGTKFDPDKRYSAPRTFTANYISSGEDIVYRALFDENAVVSVDIDMSDTEWKKLDADYTKFSASGGKSPIYRMADSVTVSIDSALGSYDCYFEEVGVRMKGNTSRHNFYSADGIYSAIHMKLSFKETFDDTGDGYTESEVKDWGGNTAARDFRKARTLGGMEKIDVKYNSTVDETYIREIYAMKLFRENDIYAPNITLCNLVANNKGASNLGVYRIHEPIDEKFVLRRGIDGDAVGDLWKCTWGRSSTGADMTANDMELNVGVENELKNEFYAYDKKTNKKKDKITGLRDLSSMKNFLTAINEPGADFGRYIDIDHFARFEAVNYVLGNPDCIRNHANNYYVYFRKSDGKAIIIPYDYDRCLGSKQWDCYNGMSGSEITPYTRRTTLSGELRNPLYKNLIVKGAPTGTDSVLMCYRENLLRIAESDGVKATAFDALKNSYKARYSAHTRGAVSNNALAFENNPAGNIPYADYIKTKLKVMKENIDNYNP